MRGARLAIALLWLPLAASCAGPLALRTLAGSPVDLELAPGGPALVAHFWATWCPSCLEELPQLERAAAGCPAERVRVFAVNVGEERAVVEEYARAHALRLPLLSDPEGRAWRELSGKGLPLNLIWSAQGRRVSLGPRAADAWERTFAELGCAAERSPPR